MALRVEATGRRPEEYALGVVLLILLGLSYLAVAVPPVRREHMPPFPLRPTAPYTSEAGSTLLPRRLASVESVRALPDILRPAGRDKIPRGAADPDPEGDGQGGEPEAMEGAGLMIDPEEVVQGALAGVPGLAALNPAQIAGRLQGSPGSSFRMQEQPATPGTLRVGSQQRQGELPVVQVRRGRTGGTAARSPRAGTGRVFATWAGPASAARWRSGPGTPAAGAATAAGAPSSGNGGMSARASAGNDPANPPPGRPAEPAGPAALARIPDPGPARPAVAEPDQAPRIPLAPAEPADPEVRRLTLAELEAAYRQVDGDKVRDAARLLRTAGLDPAAFTLDELKRAGSSAGWMTQRSRRDIDAVVTLLDGGP